MIQTYQVIQHMRSVNGFKAVTLRGEEHQLLDKALLELETIINDIKRNPNWKFINKRATAFNGTYINFYTYNYFDSTLDKNIVIDYYIETTLNE